MKKFLMAMLALVLMAGCSSEPSKPVQTEKPQPKPPEFLTGRAAFQKLFIAAHGWARVGKWRWYSFVRTHRGLQGQRRKVGGVARFLRLPIAKGSEALRVVRRRLVRRTLARHQPRLRG